MNLPENVVTNMQSEDDCITVLENMASTPTVEDGFHDDNSERSEDVLQESSENDDSEIDVRQEALQNNNHNEPISANLDKPCPICDETLPLRDVTSCDSCQLQMHL